MIGLHSIAKGVRNAYLLLAKLLRLFFCLGALHFLIKGDVGAVALFAFAFLVCDTQVRVTRLEQKVDGEL